jgi:hypothetical protein
VSKRNDETVPGGAENGFAGDDRGRLGGESEAAAERSRRRKDRDKGERRGDEVPAERSVDGPLIDDG